MPTATSESLKKLVLKAVAGDKVFFLKEDNTWTTDRSEAHQMYRFLIEDWVEQAAYALPEGTTELFGEYA